MDSSGQDQLFRAIGRISAYSNGLELYISALIWCLIGAGQQVGEIVTSELSFRNLLALLSSLYRFRKTKQEDIEKLDSLLKRASALEEQRNQVVHSTWAINMSDPNSLSRYKVTAKQKSGLKHTVEEKTIEELNHIADEMVSLMKTFSEITIEELNNQSKKKRKN